jgi:hypothetical protein
MNTKIYDDREFLTNYSIVIREQISENWEELNGFIKTLYTIVTLSLLALPFIYDMKSDIFIATLLFSVGILSILGVAYLLTFKGIMKRLYKLLIKIEALLGLFEEDPAIEKKLPQEVLGLMMADEVRSILPRKWMTTPQILQFGPNIWSFNFLFFLSTTIIYLGATFWIIFFK